MATLELNDAKFPVKIKTALTGKLFVDSITGEEHLGKPFVFHLNLVSNSDELGFDDVVGTSVTFSLEHLGGERFFNGYITEFSYAPPGESFARYRATVRPWFWFLTQTSDCRIFQEMTVPDIIKKVFADNGMVDHSFRLTGEYREWNYCVQYRESDFNFVSRLMEQEGIYYYFEHSDGNHTMVITDDMSQHKTFPGYEKVSFSIDPDYKTTSGNLDFWTATQSIMPSKYAIKDFNYSTPKVDLLSKFTITRDHASPLGDPEIYDYPGEFTTGSEGSDYAKIRLQELQCQQDRRQASGNCRGIAVGYTFTLENHFRDDQNKAYLVISMIHNFSNASFLTDSGQNEAAYNCQVEVIEKKTPFRAARQTPKPSVQGPQTAIVVGPENEEIHTDENGRIKVKFHWDREEKNDADRSCWVRVSQIWAGDKWGAIHIPRVGQEVIVSFMEGDPDQPVVTGRVYNADKMPPYDLPDNKTQSGIKSHSSKEATAENFNEIRMEDKKGEEELFIQAEKDMVVNVKNTRTETIASATELTPEDVVENIDITGSRQVVIKGNDDLHIKDGEIGQKVLIEHGGFDLKVDDKDYLAHVTKGDYTTNVDSGDYLLDVGGGKSTTNVFKDIAVESKTGKISIKAAMEITLTVGASSIKIDNSGITVKGGMIKIEGTAMLEAKAPMTTVKGDAMTTIKGGVVMIN